MNVKIEYNKKVYEINSNHGQSISISMNFNSSNNPKFYDESNPINEPYTSNDVTYDINKNAGCNVPVVKFNVHCSGTHTETGAHIFKRGKTVPLNPDVKEELKDGPGNFEPEGDL